jgi:homoserine kinase type II
LEDELRAALSKWNLGPYKVEPFGRGMGSRTWLVRTSTNRYVAKASPGGPHLDRGHEAAAVASRAGVRAAVPTLTASGDTSVPIADWRLALLTFVPGRPVDEAAPKELRDWGRTLGLVHRALEGHDELAEGLERLPLIDLEQDHLDIEPWIRPVIEPVLDEVMRFRGTIGFLHGDPAQEAFLIDDADEIGVIDWTSGWWGPLLYDLASARMYSGTDAFPALLDGYRDVADVDMTELDLFVRFRWCAQAAGFSYRIANDVMTGIDDRSENETGLSDARINLIGR